MLELWSEASSRPMIYVSCEGKEKASNQMFSFRTASSQTEQCGNFMGGHYVRRLNIADVPPVRRVRRSHGNIQDVGNFGGEAQTGISRTCVSTSRSHAPATVQRFRVFVLPLQSPFGVYAGPSAPSRRSFDLVVSC